jgi:hypothetical protein
MFSARPFVQVPIEWFSPVTGTQMFQLHILSDVQSINGKYGYSLINKKGRNRGLSCLLVLMSALKA